MPKNLFALAAAACGLVLAGSPAVDAAWNPDRVHHVDAVGQAHLFRGPSPTTNDTFVFSDMRATLQARCAEHTVVLCVVCARSHLARPSEGAPVLRY